MNELIPAFLFALAVAGALFSVVPASAYTPNHIFIMAAILALAAYGYMKGLPSLFELFVAALVGVLAAMYFPIPVWLALVLLVVSLVFSRWAAEELELEEYGL